MPGRLMDQERVKESQDLKKDRSQAQQGMQQAEPPAHGTKTANGSAHHGSNGTLSNGLPANSNGNATTNGDTGDTNMALASSSNPPPLDQSWRETESNKSLGQLMERVAQQCYFELNGCLTSMAEIPVEPQAPQQANGVVPHNAQDTSEASIKKKRLLLEFANTQRDRFIKTLVLADWCRNEEEKGRLIDVKVWQDKQRMAYVNATQAIAQTKLNMIPAKMANPNIEGAMEVLATGKASWMPDLGYIPPKRLSAKQLLKTLRNMNVALATRLNLHEELPPHFQDFSIADGRATFKVQDEFEVDLSVADEDPATPFYFIDIRLAFNPASSVTDERTRAIMENTVNAELAKNGLKGCYEFLHNFVLTHKLNVLRTQAMEMTQGKWFDCIRIENLRRSLVVQYWAGMPGPKSWLEIGISSGKQKGVRSRLPPTPKISVRWIRRGVEVKDTVLDFNWKDLNMQRCLSQVIALHTDWILPDLHARIANLLPADSPITVELGDTKVTPAAVGITLSAQSLEKPIQVRIEPVTGQMSITPPSVVTANTERRLNNDPAIDAASRIAVLPCAVTQERIRVETGVLGWTPVKNLVRQDNLASIFGERIPHFSVFTPSRSWGDKWAVAAIFTLAGERWWVVELEEKRSEQAKFTGKVIGRAHQIWPTDDASTSLPATRPSLAEMERLAVAQVSFSTLATELRNLRIPHSFEKLSVAEQKEENDRHYYTHSTALFIRFSQLIKSSQEKARAPWADEMVRLTHHGFVGKREKEGDESLRIKHDLRLSLAKGKMKELAKTLTHSKEHGLAMNSSGGLALRFLAPLGQPFVQEMQQRLHGVDRLNHYVTLLRQRHFTCTHISLARLEFTYSKTPELSAELTFSETDGSPTQLQLQPAGRNPHQRVRVFLEKGLNDIGENGFDALAFILPLTLPLLQTFERMETKDPSKKTISIHARSATHYSVTYHALPTRCKIQIQAKTRHEGNKKFVEWLISDVRAAKDTESLPEDLTKSLKELFQQKAERWTGLGTAIVADAQGVASALEKVDDVMRRFESKGESETAAKPPPAQSKTQAKAPAASKPQEQTTTKPAASAKKDPDVIMLD